MGLGTEFPLFQNLQGVELTPDEVCARLESLHRMHDQVEIVKLPMPARRLKEVSRKTSRGIVEKDRKSTRLNSSHANISYAVFCLKKKNHLRYWHWRPYYVGR